MAYDCGEMFRALGLPNASHATLARIAEDELEHASLAFAIHETLLPRLGPDAREWLRHAAIAALDVTALANVEGAVREAAGLPSDALVGVLLGRLRIVIERVFDEAATDPSSVSAAA